MKIKYILISLVLITSLLSSCVEKPNQDEYTSFYDNVKNTTLNITTPGGQLWNSKMNISYEQFKINECNEYYINPIFTLVINDTKNIDNDIVKMEIVKSRCDSAPPEYRNYCIIEVIKMLFSGHPDHLSEPTHGTMINSTTGNFTNNTIPDCLVVKK